MLQFFFKKTPMQDVTEEDVNDPVEAEEAQVDVNVPKEVDSDGECLWGEGWRHLTSCIYVEFFFTVGLFLMWKCLTE